MELETFVAETLKQIIDGVAKAQADAKGKKAVINPARRVTTMSTRETRKTDDPGRHESIEFDVAVTAGEGTEKRGGFGVFVSSLALGGQGQATTNTQFMSRVRFTVPILLPVQKRPE